MKLLVHPQELDRTIIDEIAQCGADKIGIHPVGGAIADKSLADMLVRLQTDAARNLIDYAKARGIGVEYEVHAGSFLAPRNLFAEHPEYFREENGARTDKINFCPSSEQMLNIVAENAVSLAKKLYGSSDKYYFWLDDVGSSGCECDKCRDLSPSDQQMKAVNAIAVALKKINPSAKVAFLAYHATMTPPEKIAPENNVFLEYAPIERNRKIFVGEDKTVQSELLAFRRVFPAASTEVLEYWYDNSFFSGWRKPPKRFIPDNAVIEKELCYYSSLGVKEIASFACYLGADYRELYGAPDFSAIKNFAKNKRL